MEKKQGFYQIKGTDGHIYDSFFLSESKQTAREHIKECARRIRESGDELTGEARFKLTKTNDPSKVQWNYLTV